MENMQTPNIGQRLELNPQPWRCKTNMLTTKRHCYSLSLLIFKPDPLELKLKKQQQKKKTHLTATANNLCLYA